MVSIDTRQATSDIRRAMLFLNEKEIKTATARAINHTLGKAKTAMSKEIRSVYRIAAADVNSEMGTKRANVRNLSGHVLANGAPLSLTKFNPIITSYQRGGVLTNTRRTGGRKSGFSSTQVTRLGWNTGVSVEIAKGKKVSLPSAFLMFANGGSGSIMARGNYNGSAFSWDKPRLPITKLNSKSIYWASQNSSVIDKMSVISSNDFTNRFLHELTSGLSNARIR